MTKENLCSIACSIVQDEYLIENSSKFIKLLDFNYVFRTKEIVYEYVNISVVNHMMQNSLELDILLQDILEGSGGDLDDNVYEYVYRRLLAYNEYAAIMADFTTEDAKFLCEFFTHLVRDIVFENISRIESLLKMIGSPYIEPVSDPMV